MGKPQGCLLTDWEGFLQFDSRETCQAVLASPEGQAALADLNTFATGGVTFVANEEEVLLPIALTRA